ncbi:hypothetical protein BU24DRAFT_469740 [Aaosphaeria arxii CBS 175.79]|uniref:Glyoxalase-like domain-containing protein n=1 Tax=Aaosphaeria arxii CBS 175.79 TaxID=1450172 RepID=A0A6A5Y6Y4_9PLEO|nr:uncharacterized protein BU24DRAFT_469740 [Aaosphaeria arxii CBS 175.79]KAF2020983.1 hypothetical protein BU24DRAFT_469740 [Aaosphaeria arxii CBS 175.79]
MASPSLDHLVLFLPHSPSTDFPVIPSSLSNAFTLTPGGHHADGLTSNTLIILADGCYIELITFLPQPSTSTAVQTHWWGGPPPTSLGWKDWCLTSTDSPSANHARIASSHAAPIKGGRKRPDGKEVKWAVTFPEGENGGQGSRGRVPFWCHDETERGLRVPGEEERVRHASGVLGVEGLSVVVGGGEEGLEALKRVYEGVLGVEGRKGDGEVVFEVGRVIDVEGLSKGPRIVIKLPRSEEEVKRVEEKGFWFGDVVLAAKKEGKAAGTVERVDMEEDGIRGIWIKYI